MPDSHFVRLTPEAFEVLVRFFDDLDPYLDQLAAVAATTDFEEGLAKLTCLSASCKLCRKNIVESHEGRQMILVD